MPPSCCCRPMGQGGVLSLMVGQISVVHHDINSVKVPSISTLPQDMFKDQLPVGTSDLTSDFILQWCSPTWAGTFVLAALVAVFPGINFVLLDSDCLPVTLFEVEDLWAEAYLARFPDHCESGIPQAHPLRALARYSKDS